ncbi:type II toxin-antitoxin system HicA family toxin [Roseomonas sp. BN140053]|uniref:type II toxin-antitoxin system HicA family toxin n=1 Tax=Roseomonas sp. BN140053 TaxID=3391898 RepID=UPI0039EC6026
MNARDTLKILKADGWVEHSQKGSYLHLKHPTRAGKVTVPMHGATDLSPGVLRSIEHQSGTKLRRT